MPKPTKKGDKEEKCHFCKAKLDEGSLCHGCNVYICDTCDVSCGSTPMGMHDPKDHRIDPDKQESVDIDDEEEEEGEEE